MNIHPFQTKSKFAMVTVNNVYTDLPATAFQLSDGTSVLPAVPVPDLGIWKEWIGSIRMERLGRANLVLFLEEPSDNPEILDAVHQRLDKDLSLSFYMLHLRTGIEIADGADLLCGSSVNRVPGIRQMSQMPAFHHSKGWKRARDDRVARRRRLASCGRHRDGGRQDAVQACHSRPEYTVQRPEGDWTGPSPSVRPGGFDGIIRSEAGVFHPCIAMPIYKVYRHSRRGKKRLGRARSGTHAT